MANRFKFSPIAMPGDWLVWSWERQRLLFIWLIRLEFRYMFGWMKPVRETRAPRLTAWELAETGIPHTVIPDNTGGHLMQHQMVDLVLVGSDRTTLNGDVANNK